MSKTHVFLIAFAALIVGAVAGGWGVTQFAGRRTAVRSMAAEASITVDSLKRLRAGDTTGAAELLEVRLDGTLIVLGAILPEIPKSQRDSELRIIETARDYRIKFPRTSHSPKDAEGVARAFALLDGQPKH